MLTNSLQQTPLTRNTQTTRKQKQIIAAFDDLHAHGDDTAAALALGDLWLTLPPVDRAAVVTVIKELAGADEAEPLPQKMLLAFQSALTGIFG